MRTGLLKISAGSCKLLPALRMPPIFGEQDRYTQAILPIPGAPDEGDELPPRLAQYLKPHHPNARQPRERWFSWLRTTRRASAV